MGTSATPGPTGAVAGEPEPRKPRRVFSIRVLMLLVLIAALPSMYGKHLLDQKRHTLRTETYYVNDLVPVNEKPENHPDHSQLNQLAATVKAEAPKDPWLKGSRSITPFFLNNSLIVRDSEIGHQHVAEWLKKRRSLSQNGPSAARPDPGN